MGRIGIWEIALILLVLILLFGIKRLPDIGRSLGKAIKEFRRAGKDVKEQLEDSDSEDKGKN